MTTEKQDLLRLLPSVSSLLDHEEVVNWLDGASRSVVVASLQCALEGARKEILSGDVTSPMDESDLLALAEEELLRRLTPSLIPVINATGIVLHTGLGRAPLCQGAVEAIAEGAAGYCNLEFELETGNRGKRVAHVASRIAEVTGAESATVVNNNAAATLLILRTFAEGKEAIVSRGQLVEIGGSYRLPDVMTASGASLCEVGTTNRTRITDYEKAICDRTAILMHVHTSNYRVVGFTESTPIEELADLAHRYGLLAVDDLGSGAIFDYSQFGLPEEPCALNSLKSGSDLVCFSGDKLLGGPQCGIIVGKRELIERIEKSPLMRSYRVCKLTLLALEATLAHFNDPAEAIANIPTLSMLCTSTEELAGRARKLNDMLKEALSDEDFYVCSDVGYAGGGTLPGREVETVVVQWRPKCMSTEEVATRLRNADISVVVRIRDDAICLDLRTLLDEDFEPLVESIATTVLDSIEEDD